MTVCYSYFSSHRPMGCLRFEQGTDSLSILLLFEGKQQVCLFQKIWDSSEEVLI